MTLRNRAPAARPARISHLLLRCVSLSVALIGALGLLFSHEVSAHDGALRWTSLRGPSVEVHCPANLVPFAGRVLAVAEDALRTLKPLFNYRPPLPLQITVEDYRDGTNGYAASFPYDHIVIRAYPPAPSDDLSGHGDWLRGLVFHEISHILHIGDAGGVAALINTALGRTYLPNQYLPRFFLEGLATRVETRHVGGDLSARRLPSGEVWGGRVEGAPFMGRLRAATRGGGFPAIHSLIGHPLAWPRERGWYVFGSWLLDYQVRRYGSEKLREFIGLYGRRLLPYAINNVYRQVYGQSALSLWREAIVELKTRTRMEEALRSTGLVPPLSSRGVMRAHAALRGRRRVQLPGPVRRLSADGEGRGRLRMVPGGRAVVLTRAPADDVARIEKVALIDGAVTVLQRCELDCDDAVITPDGRWLLWVASRAQGRSYRHRDLFARRLDELARPVGAPLRLSEGLRVRDLSVDPKGEAIWGVAVSDGKSAIVRLPLQAAIASARRGAAPPKVIKVVEAASFAEVLASPVVTASGRLLFTRGRGWRRELCVGRLDPRTRLLGTVRALPPLEVEGIGLASEVTGARPAPAQVAWMDDLQILSRPEGPVLGALVQLGSYRDAAELPLGEIVTLAGSATPVSASQGVAPRWRLRSWSPTSAVSAAFSSLRSEAVILQTEAAGLDLYRLAPLSPSRSPHLRSSSAASGRQSEGALDAPFRPYLPPSVSAIESPYAAWRSLYPRAWTPLAQLVATGATPTPADLILGFSVGGRDVVGLYHWGVSAQSDLALNHPRIVLSTAIERWEPTWTLASSWARVDAWARRGERFLRLQAQETTARLGGQWGLSLGRDTIGVEAGLRFFDRALLGDMALWRLREGLPVPYGPEPIDPLDGSEVGASAGFSWGRSERYPDSTVTEHRRSLSVYGSWTQHLRHPELRLLRLDAHAQLAWPLGGHRVLSWRGRLGWGARYPPNAPPYRLVGLASPNVEALLFGGAGGDFGVVRGVSDPTHAGRLVAGRALAWSSLSLHLPLYAIGRGLELLPVFLGRSWLTLFSDAAMFSAGDEARLREGQTQAGSVISAGAEVSVDLEVAYIPQGALKLGWARAFGDISTSQWYIRLGL